MHQVKVGNFNVGKGQPLMLMMGPCVIESEEATLQAAVELKKILSRFPVNFVFKSSYDKANRTSIDSYRGPGLEEGLRILQRVKDELGLPVVTDVHSPEEARAAGNVCDIIQIPAFLCRQTDLVVAAGETGKAVQVKKGQFLAPWDIENIVKKIESTGNHNIIMVDRGVSFGYNNLVSDMRSIPIMQKLGYPVCYDATHSVQLPGGLGGSSGGQREFIPILARAAVASGANALFMEAHPEPAKALSDSASMLPFSEVPKLIELLVKLYEVIQENG